MRVSFELDRNRLFAKTAIQDAVLRLRVLPRRDCARGVSAVNGRPQCTANRVRALKFYLESECTAEEEYKHTGGRSLFACGSPFEPVRFNGQVFVPRQGNNSYIFPGVGGAIASGARRVTDEMFMSAARTLATLIEDSDREQGSLYPALPRIRDVSAHNRPQTHRAAHHAQAPRVADRGSNVSRNLMAWTREQMAAQQRNCATATTSISALAFRPWCRTTSPTASTLICRARMACSGWGRFPMRARKTRT